MTALRRPLATLHPPEPLQGLSAALVRAALQLGPLPRWAERYPLTAMSPAARQAAWAVGRKITRNEDHGFAIAERVPPNAVGSLWQLYEVAPCIAAIHERYDSFSALLLDTSIFSLSVTDTSSCVAHRSEPWSKVDRAEEDFRAAMQVATWRGLLREPSLAPLSVHFTYARPASTEAHKRALGCHNLRFAQPCFQLELARRWWDSPLPASDVALFESRLHAARAAAELHTQSALDVQVDGLFLALLSRDPSAQAVASALGLSVRTLRRKLAEGGQTLRAIAERVRQREAQLLREIDELVGQPAHSSAERARLLGFANPGALRNALKRWRTG
jgi:AraC-like DNA-binding protein